MEQFLLNIVFSISIICTFYKLFLFIWLPQDIPNLIKIIGNQYREEYIADPELQLLPMKEILQRILCHYRELYDSIICSAWNSESSFYIPVSFKSSISLFCA